MHRVLRTTRTVASAVASAVTLAMAFSACSGITDANTPSNLVTQSTGETQQGAVALYQGALVQFSQAYGASSTTGLPAGSLSYTYYNYTLVNGLFSDEFTGGYNDYDSRVTTNLTENGGTGPYAALHAARLTMARALVALGQYPTALPPSYRGELHALQGYISLMFAELYCSGVPFSHLDNSGVVVFGMPESSTQMYQDAIAQFDTATMIATDSARIQQLAAIGKARALLDLGEYDSAATAASAVPTTFVSNANFSSAHLIENIWYAEAEYVAASSYGQASYYIANGKGGNGVLFTSAADPRLPLQAAGGYYDYSHYPVINFVSLDLPAAFAHAADLPIPVATGIEGQLITAEAALKRGDPSWLTTLNTLRSSVPGLSALGDPGTDTGRVSLLFSERAFWLFGTGHRTGDLRRLIRQYGRLEQNVFPVGANPVEGVTFGTQVNLEPPQNELNNPNYHGCLNRDA
jgi:hypothetical protein